MSMDVYPIGGPPGPAGTNSVFFSAGTLGQTRSDITFANSNGVSFGLSANGVITASAAAGGGGSLNISAGTTSSSVSAVTFSNANGVSFGFDGSNVTATVATNYQSSGAYLTTAMASNRGSDFVQATAAFHGTNASGTINSNNISVSVAPPSSLNISAGTISSNVTAVTFSNANGVSFGYDGTNVTATVQTNYLTTAMASNRGSDFVQATAAFHGTNASGTINSNDVSISVAAGTNSSWTVSDAVTSATVGRLAFTNSNGLTLSLSTSNNGNHTVIGSYTVPTVTNSSLTLSDANTSMTIARLAFTNSNGLTLSLSTTTGGSATLVGSYTVPNVPAATSWTVSDAVTSATVGRLAFTNSNGLTLTLSTSNNGNHTVIGSYTVPTVTNSSLTLSDAVTSMTIGRLAFTNSNGLTLTLSTTTGGSATLIGSYTVPSTAGLISAVKISAGASSSNVSAVTFSNSNGVSFGYDGTAITATVQTNYLTTAALSSQTLALANSQATYSTGTVNFLEGGGAVTIATSAGGQSLMFSVPQTSSLVGVNGITVSTNGSTISISAGNYLTTAASSSAMASYWANLEQFNNATTTMCQSNSFYVFPITIRANVSASYLRLPVSFNFTSTSIATSAVNNASGASTAFSETVAFNALLYTVGAGANSRSLQEVYSTSAGLTWAVSVSQASTSNATNQSFTQAITFPNEGANTGNISTQYSVSATNGPISTTQWSNLSAQRYLDIPFATSLSAGNYWIALNRFSGTVGGKNLDCNCSTYGVSNSNLTFANMNSATNLSNAFPFAGLGVWTQAAAATSASIGLASVSVTTSYMLPFVQLIRQA